MSRSRSSTKLIGAFSISKQPVQWNLDEIPLYNHLPAYKQFSRTLSRERVEYLAELRNGAVRGLTREHPSIEHIMNVDSYYTNQTVSLRKLVSEYQQSAREMILGASNWFRDEANFIRPKTIYWDTWTTPEGLKFSPLEKGWRRVSAVGGVIIYPRWVWEKVGYAVPPYYPKGCEMNHICTESGLPVYLSLNVKTWHPSPYSRVPLALRITKVAKRKFRKVAMMGQRSPTFSEPRGKEVNIPI